LEFYAPHRIALCGVFYLGEMIMIAVLKHGTTPEQVQQLVTWLKHMNVDVHISEGKEVTILGLIGDTSRVDMDLLGSLEMVSSVKRVSEPFKQVNRKFHPNDSVIQVADVKIGGGNFVMIAGPCSVETEEQIPELIEKTYKISGMMCGHCEAHVKEALEAIPEITEAKASCLYDNAVVKMTSEVSEEKIREAIEKAGYHLI
jgi:copper chaperone CopZ